MLLLPKKTRLFTWQFAISGICQESGTNDMLESSFNKQEEMKEQKSSCRNVSDYV